MPEISSSCIPLFHLQYVQYSAAAASIYTTNTKHMPGAIVLQRQTLLAVNAAAFHFVHGTGNLLRKTSTEKRIDKYTQKNGQHCCFNLATLLNSTTHIPLPHL
jgi:hypothetical protein